MSQTEVTNEAMHDIADPALAPAGKHRIEWAASQMPVVRTLMEQFTKEQPLKGMRVAACLHVTSETANLMRALKAGGAEVYLCASNPLSTSDEVAASLVVDYGIPTFAIRGEDNDVYYRHIEQVLEKKPHFTMDDGCDLVSTLHTKYPEILKEVVGGTEETTTGVIRLRAMVKDGVLKYPVIAINDADTKHFFDNRYGTGQSTLDGILRATNGLIAGSTFVVAGYGWCGRGLASRARGMGARVIVTEIDPIKALEATMDGFEVLPMEKAAPLGNYFVTVTGNRSVIRREHFQAMRDGAVVANSGHFNVEIDIPDLEEIATNRRETRPMVVEYQLEADRKIYVLGEGRLINLAAAEGHPAAVMDMSFANQALSVKYLTETQGKISVDCHVVPRGVDAEVARLKLEAMKIAIDKLTAGAGKVSRFLE